MPKVFNADKTFHGFVNTAGETDVYAAVHICSVFVLPVLSFFRYNDVADLLIPIYKMWAASLSVSNFWPCEMIFGAARVASLFIAFVSFHMLLPSLSKLNFSIVLSNSILML